MKNWSNNFFFQKKPPLIPHLFLTLHEEFFCMHACCFAKHAFMKNKMHSCKNIFAGVEDLFRRGGGRGGGGGHEKYASMTNKMRCMQKRFSCV